MSHPSPPRPPAGTARRPLSAGAALGRYGAGITALGLVIFLGSTWLSGMVGLAGPALLGAAVVTVLLGRAIGWVALVGPLVPAAVWSIALIVLIVSGTDPGSQERGLSSLFAFLAIALVVIGGEVCVVAGCLWRAVRPPQGALPPEGSPRR